MRRRCQKKVSAKQQEDQFKQLPSDIEEQAEQNESPRKNRTSTLKRITKKTKSKSKSFAASNSSFEEDSQQSQVLEFRHADEASREHTRPEFLKKWDGISNQFEMTYSQINQLSPIFKVYWKVKSRNMNAVIFMEFGKREFLAFENDAIKLHQLYKKKLKKYSKFLMVGFWYKEIENVKKDLFERKIPVLIMNQIEDSQYRQQNGIVRRQVQEVITPGLHLQYQDTAPRSRLLLAIYFLSPKFAILILDAQNNHFYLQQLEEDNYMHELRRILNKYRPVQLVVPDKDHREISQIAKQICNPYIIEVSIERSTSNQTIKGHINRFLSINSSTLFLELEDLYKIELQLQTQEIFTKFRLVNALILAWRYLQSLSLLQKIFYQGIFHSLSYKFDQKTNFFDSQVYQNLEIFRIKSQEQQTYAKSGTLMGYLDKCRTIHGRKMLHKWIDQPLTNFEQILNRQESVKQLVEENPKLLIFHDRFCAYEKFEKKLGDIYHWISRNSQRGKLILTRYINYQKEYDLRKNPAVVRLKQIIEALKLIKQYESLLKELSKFNINSKILKKNILLADVDNIHKFSIEEINKLDKLPEIGYVADIILRRISYDEITGILEPVFGQNEVFDQEKKEVDRINQLLTEQLNKWKQYFKTDKISYVSIRSKNEIQVPKAAIRSSKPNSDLIFSSETANCVRYTTPQTYRLSDEIIQHQQAISQSYQPFLQTVIQQFCNYRFLWNLFIESMAKIDVLMSLAQTAKTMGVKCIPTFQPYEIQIKKSIHVNLISVKEQIIPNSITLNQNQRVLLLTGPNMGGKSTFLKQVCILAILAQIGSYIPAQNYTSKIYDQIFCRMGASDRIYQGKSTFYVELQQTKRIISKATAKSLVVIDELGRGTSTFDGMAIAEAVLEHLINNIQSTTLYSTHYTQITEKFTGKPEVKLMKMGYEMIEQDIKFTYQLVQGVAERSFAGNVGKMVGIPSAILELANKKSEQMHHQTRLKKSMRQACRLIDIHSCRKQKGSNLEPHVEQSQK